MIGTYAAALAVCASSLAIGQAALTLCGMRTWSWLSPAVGLALVSAACWATVRLPGDGVVAALVVVVGTGAASAFLWRRLEGGGEALRTGLPVGLIALGLASLPFLVEGHFGILGTGFNPDMSQHLLATDRLAEGASSQLLQQGYPLGPHAIVVALHQGLGIGLVQGFGGLTAAVAVLAPLTALAAFRDQPPVVRVSAALLVGLPYMVASYFAQGAFKETMQALFVLAFVLALREASWNPTWRERPLRFAPAALIAVGSVYAYSFPGLIWLLPTAVLWMIGEYAARRFHLSAGGAESGGSRTNASPAGSPGSATGPAAWRSGLLALLLFCVLIAPEIGRMIDFQRFETFDPNGPGLGNLFGPISPFEALGIWPSGDFRLSPGDGAMPAFGYYLGAAFAALLLIYGAVLCWVRRETAILAGLVAVAAAYLAARVVGTPYTAAKAIEIAAPLATLAILLPLLRRPVAILYFLAAAGCSVLALANAPVGPRDYSPALTEMRPLVGPGPTLVLASSRLLEEEHGHSYIAWELRGGRVCIEAEGSARQATGAAGGASESPGRPPAGIRFVVTEGANQEPPFAGLRLRRRADPYLLWERMEPPRGASDCPLIAVRQARQGPAR